MLRRLLFCICFVLYLPISILTLLFLNIYFITAVPIVWVLTGDEDKALYFILDNNVFAKILYLPFYIIDKDF